MVEGTTMAYTGAIQLACNGDRYSYKILELRNVHVALQQLPEDIT